MFFPSFPFSKKSGLFFARLVARNFTRALGTPSARLRMGRATRAALNAGRCQRGYLLTQMAVKGGGALSYTTIIEISRYEYIFPYLNND